MTQGFYCIDTPSDVLRSSELRTEVHQFKLGKQAQRCAEASLIFGLSISRIYPAYVNGSNSIIV